jgi:hypothetical protein
MGDQAKRRAMSITAKFIGKNKYIPAILVTRQITYQFSMKR